MRRPTVLQRQSKSLLPGRLRQQSIAGPIQALRRLYNKKYVVNKCTPLVLLECNRQCCAAIRNKQCQSEVIAQLLAKVQAGWARLEHTYLAMLARPNNCPGRKLNGTASDRALLLRRTEPRERHSKSKSTVMSTPCKCF